MSEDRKSSSPDSGKRYNIEEPTIVRRGHLIVRKPPAEKPLEPIPEQSQNN